MGFDALGNFENFNTNYIILAVIIEDHSRFYFLGIDNFGIIESQVQRIRLFVNS